jgi:hypothetical protein
MESWNQDKSSAAELMMKIFGDEENTSMDEPAEEFEISTMGSKLNTLNQSILNLNAEVVALNSAIAIQTKNQKLQWAIANAGINSFHFYAKGKKNQLESTSFVKTILFSFRKGTGHYITNRSLHTTGLEMLEER